MISKQQQNMAILDEEINFAKTTMDEMPTNLSLDKSHNCDNQVHEEQTSTAATNSGSTRAQDYLSEKEKIDNDKNKSHSIKTSGSDRVKDFPNETRIQLSFSVDRLLNHKTSESSDHHRQKLMDSEKCCEEMNNGYSCCSLPNCLVNTTNPSSMTFAGSTFQNNDEDIHMASPSSFMDFKSVVRPTPMRAMGNNSEQVPTITHFSPLTPTTLIRLHHAQLHQKQMPPHLPAQPNFTLSSLMSPLCGMKPMHANPQQMQNFPVPAPPNSRFASKASINFDIPGMRPNLTCISNLRHHHLTPSTPNEAHMNFSAANTNPSTGSGPSSANSGNSATISNGKRKRSWSRAVFSNLQRKGLEIQFQQQKYITKPDRRKLAARLNLTDAQVKVWFQNRRMKWRHTRENLKSGQEKQPATDNNQSSSSVKANADIADNPAGPGYSSDGSSSLELSDADDDDDEIDVVQ